MIGSRLVPKMGFRVLTHPPTPETNNHLQKIYFDHLAYQAIKELHPTENYMLRICFEMELLLSEVVRKIT